MDKYKISRRKFLAYTISASTILLPTYIWQIEPFWFETVRRSIVIKNLPIDLVGKKLIQLSDLHIGPLVDDHYIKSVFAHVRSLDPDIVIYTGDFITYHPDVIFQLKRQLESAPLGNLGTFGVLGNHDYGNGWANMQLAFQVQKTCNDSGITILKNQIEICSGLQIIGLDDLWANKFDLNVPKQNYEKNTASICLSHNPDSVDKPGGDFYSGWIFSGHTHGGQCKPPFLPPPLLPVKNKRYTSGTFELLGDRRIYISRGVGFVRQLRFNARPEVGVFYLERG